MDPRVLVGVFDLAPALLHASVHDPLATTRLVLLAAPATEGQVARRCCAGVEVLVEPGAGGHEQAVLLPVQFSELALARRPHDGEAGALEDQQERPAPDVLAVAMG